MGGLIARTLLMADRVSEEPSLRVNGRGRFASIEGGLISIIGFLLVVGFSVLEVRGFLYEKVVKESHTTRFQSNSAPVDYSESGFLPILSFMLPTYISKNTTLKDVEDIFYISADIQLWEERSKRQFIIKTRMVACSLLDADLFKKYYIVDQQTAIPPAHDLKHLTLCIDASDAERQIRENRAKFNLNEDSPLAISSTNIFFYPCDPAVTENCGKMTELERYEVLLRVNARINMTLPNVDFSNGLNPVTFPSKFNNTFNFFLFTDRSIQLTRELMIGTIEDKRGIPFSEPSTHNYWKWTTSKWTSSKTMNRDKVPLSCTERQRESTYCNKFGSILVQSSINYEKPITKREMYSLVSLLGNIGGLYSFIKLIGRSFYKYTVQKLTQGAKRDLVGSVFGMKPPAKKCCKKKRKELDRRKDQQEREARERKEFEYGLKYLDRILDVGELMKELCLLKLLFQHTANMQTQALVPLTALRLAIRDELAAKEPPPDLAPGQQPATKQMVIEGLDEPLTCRDNPFRDTTDFKPPPNSLNRPSDKDLYPIPDSQTNPQASDGQDQGPLHLGPLLHASVMNLQQLLPGFSKEGGPPDDRSMQTRNDETGRNESLFL